MKSHGIASLPTRFEGDVDWTARLVDVRSETFQVDAFHMTVAEEEIAGAGTQPRD